MARSVTPTVVSWVGHAAAPLSARGSALLVEGPSGLFEAGSVWERVRTSSESWLRHFRE